MLHITKLRQDVEVSTPNNTAEQEFVADPIQANVDEVFIDLCRQIIRRDNNASPSGMEEEIVQPYGQGQGRRERRPHRHSRRRKKDSNRCMIL